MPENNGFIKLNRSKEVEHLIEEFYSKRPTAYVLLTIIALRARRSGEKHLDDLQIGEAYIGVGDYLKMGLTEQIYRTDKKYLEKYGFSTFKSTSKGTIALLCNDLIFDINPSSKLTNKLTVSQRTANGQLTTNKNDKNVKNDKKYIEEYISTFNRLFNKSYQVSEGRDMKLGLRLKRYSFSQILEALNNLSMSKWHRGDNDRKWVADPDFLLRNDEQVDKWLNSKVQNLQEKPRGDAKMLAIEALRGTND